MYTHDDFLCVTLFFSNFIIFFTYPILLFIRILMEHERLMMVALKWMGL